MPRLIHQPSHRLIASHVIQAKTLKQRIKGLIGYSELKDQEVFWITACPGIHTFFMKFPIDVIFTDQKLCVVSVFESVSAGKMLFGGFRSQNVFEMKSGQIQKHGLKKGDQLYVEH